MVLELVLFLISYARKQKWRTDGTDKPTFINCERREIQDPHPRAWRTSIARYLGMSSKIAHGWS
jgi:hypothetical protein